MALKRLTPNLMVENVADTVEFYEKTLGFTLQQSVPEGDGLAWASVRSGDVEIMFQSRSSLSREIPALKDAPAGGALTLYIRM
ncbi:MAG: VOC family protein, partial [Bacillota bacterium]